MSINLIFKLTHIRTSTKDSIKLRIITSEANGTQLFLWKVVIKFIGINWITIIVFVLYHIQWLNWNLSNFTMLCYQKLLVFDENDGLFASKAFKECEHASRFAMSIDFISRIQRWVLTECVTYSPCIWFEWNEHSVLINGVPETLPKVFKVDVIHNTFLDIVECFQGSINLCFKHW